MQPVSGSQPPVSGSGFCVPVQRQPLLSRGFRVLLLLLPLLSLSLAQQLNASDLPSPFVSDDFIKSAQNIPENDYNRLSDIHQMVMILYEHDSTLSALAPETKSRLIKNVRSFQNPNGGFGDWENDRSKTESTRLALETLKALGSGPMNRSGAVHFLSDLQVTNLTYGNYGFRSHLQDPDADLSSTYDAIVSFELLGEPVPNSVQAVEYVKQHQNKDGGFGLGTNRKAGVSWPSEMSLTYRGLRALDSLGSKPDFEDEAVSYIKGLQTADGGFSASKSISARATTAATYNAIMALEVLGEAPDRPADARSFLENNAGEGGGFLENSLDTEESLHSTYWAIAALKTLGAGISGFDSDSYALGYDSSRNDGGFGEFPGGGSSIRYTFDAIYALNLIGAEPMNKSAAISFLRQLRNSDGGYAEDGGVSNVESTYRAVFALRLLGEEPEDKNRTIAFLRESQDKSGGFGWSSVSIPRGAYTYRAVKALELLGSAPENGAKAADYIRSLQNPDGGFGNYPGDVSDVTSTYRAVATLESLGGAPDEPEKAAAFILASQNPDGGFRRSPYDTKAPDNFSKAVYTYGAVNALIILGRAPQPRVFNFTESLRNPDLGYSEQPFYTSTVPDTFTSLQTYMSIFPGIVNHVPALSGIVSPSAGNSSTVFQFFANYSDSEGQKPEAVYVLIDGEQRLMEPAAGSGSNASASMRYSFRSALPSGMHNVSFLAGDTILFTKTGNIPVDVSPLASAPELDLSIYPGNGTPSTAFVFTALYRDADGEPPAYVEIKLDESEWAAMSPADSSADYLSGKPYKYNASLQPGIHTFRARTSDGTNLRLSTTQRVTVFEESPVSPDDVVFLKMQALIAAKRGINISKDDVSADVFEGKFAWRVSLPAGALYVSKDGTALLEPEQVFDMRPVLIVAGLAILVALAYLWHRGRTRGKGR
ncbi:MAG: prenyltransferase/squalene oxidase repeat-containing protein [Candidatus Micrarchaeota archaeon]